MAGGRGRPQSAPATYIFQRFGLPLRHQVDGPAPPGGTTPVRDVRDHGLHHTSPEPAQADHPSHSDISLCRHRALSLCGYIVVSLMIAMIRSRSSPVANSIVIRPLLRPMFTFTRVSK